MERVSAIPLDVCEDFSEEITPGSREALVAKMVEHAYHDVKRVVLDVSSPGGEMVSAMHLYDALCSTPFLLVTRNTGEIASMGNLVFLAGDERVASDEATFLLHPLTLLTPSGARLDINDLRQKRMELERTHCMSPRAIELDRGIARLASEEQALQRIFEARTSLTGPEIETLVTGHVLIDAAYACAVGIVHEIIPARGQGLCSHR